MQKKQGSNPYTQKKDASVINLNGRPRKSNHKSVRLEDPPEDTRPCILILLLLAGLLAALILTAIEYQDMPMRWIKSGTERETGTSEKDEGKTEPRPLYLGYDKTADIDFINNAVIVFFQNNTTAEQMREAAQLIGGTIDARLSDSCYRVWLPESHGYEELNRLCELIGTTDCVDHAAIDALLKTHGNKEGDCAI